MNASTVKSFADRLTVELFEGKGPRKLERLVAEPARKQLERLDAVTRVTPLRTAA